MHEASEARRGGAVLLEVVFSLAIFAATVGAVCGAFQSSSQAMRQLLLEATASDLAVTLLSEIQMGTVAAQDDGPTEYPPPYRNWTSQVTVVDGETTVEGVTPLRQVRITIANVEDGFSYSLTSLAPPPAESAASSGSDGSSGTRP